MKRLGVALIVISAVLVVMWVQSLFVSPEDGDPIEVGRAPFDS